MKKYISQDITFIVPTKDRPEKISNLLESLVAQSVPCGRILIVDGGRSIENIVNSFKSSLDVEYLNCYPPGQIRQRNHAISYLDSNTILVGLLDDDIVLEHDAIEKMVNFWNDTDKETAAVSFNIVNISGPRHSIVKYMFGLSSRRIGSVLRSGYNVSIISAPINTRTQWVSGGATIWKKEILLKHRQKEVSSRWASCEDLIFSYPIGKLFPLYVCADARVRHEHVYDHVPKMRDKYYGYTETLWRFYFVHSHRELSKLFFLWMITGVMIGRCALGIFKLQKRQFEFVLGQLLALLIIYKSNKTDTDLLVILNEKNDFI